MIDAWYWHTAVPLLTLDSVSPFFPFMGLREVDGDALRSVLRKSFVAAAPAKPEIGHEKLATQAVADLERSLGAATVEKLERWMTSVLFPPPDSTYNAWLYLLAISSQDPLKWRELNLPDDRAEELRLMFLKFTNDQKLKSLFREVSSRQLSEWDLAIFSLFHYYRDDKMPLATVMSATERHQLFSFWEELRKTISPSEFKEFIAAAQRLAKTKGMSVTLGPPL